MVSVNNWRSSDTPVPDVAKLAEAIVLKIAGGWMFVTHEGEMIGPDADRDTVVAKAALYLSANRGAQQ